MDICKFSRSCQKLALGGLWRKNLHERLTLEFEARARFLKDVLCELRSVVLSRAHPQYPPTISTLSPLTQIQRRNNVFKLAWTQATDGHTGGFMLPFPVSRDDRASMAAEAGLADVGRESKGLTVGKHVETTGQSNFYAAMVGHGIDRSKFCTMMSIATDGASGFRSEKGGGTLSISNGRNEIASSGQVTRGTPHKVFGIFKVDLEWSPITRAWIPNYHHTYHTLNPFLLWFSGSPTCEVGWFSWGKRMVEAVGSANVSYNGRTRFGLGILLQSAFPWLMWYIVTCAILKTILGAGHQSILIGVNMTFSCIPIINLCSHQG